MAVQTEEATDTIVRIKEFYVYELFDKRDGKVFYVGEGVRERGHDHYREAEKILTKLAGEEPERVNHAKIARIAEIRSAGEEHLGIRVVGRFDTKHEAQAVEAILINWIYGIDNLTNISRGRGSAHMRPRELAFEEVAGIDIPRQLVPQGSGRRVPGYLKKMIENHEKHRHFSMAEDIARQLADVNLTLDTEEPCYWEYGRYVALFITLVPGKVRMIIQLTDSGRHQHVYNIIPISNRKADKDVFIHFMEEHHKDLELVKDGLYCKLPRWKNLKVKNEDLPEIISQVRYAKQFFESADGGESAS